jgi:hypothetical protein
MMGLDDGLPGVATYGGGGDSDEEGGPGTRPEVPILLGPEAKALVVPFGGVGVCGVEESSFSSASTLLFR